MPHDLKTYRACILDIHARVQKQKLELGELTPASVLVPLFEKNGEAHLLFVKRTLTVRHHKGQVSFPGGARDVSDRLPVDTALRETHEEIGVRPVDVDVLTELDDMITPTQFRVTPFVGIIPYPYDFFINPLETAELIEVPMRHLLNEAHHRLGYRRFQDRIYEVHYFDYDRHVIWGVTGNILVGLLNRIRSAASLVCNFSPGAP